MLYISILLLLIPSLLAQVFFSVSTPTVTPNTARNPNSQYQILLTATTTFSNNFDISINFASAFALASVTGCSISLNGASVSTASCSLSSNVVTFSNLNINQNVNTISIGFTTSTALYSGQFLTSFSYYTPGNTASVLGSNSVNVVVSNAAMTCTLVSTSNVVGAAANYTLSYTPSVTISSQSILQINFPAWSAYTLTNFPSFSSASTCSGQCTQRAPSTSLGYNNQLITYSSLFSANTSSSGSLLLLNARNPATTQPISVTVSILYFISSTSKPSYMTCTTSLTASTPSQFKGVTFAPTNQAISSSNSISLQLSLSNPISSTTYLVISYANDLGLSYSYLASSQQTVPQIFTNSPYLLTLNVLTNSSTFFTSFSLATFTITMPPYASLPNTVTFLTQNLVGSTYYQIDTFTVSLTSTVSTITSALVAVADPTINTLTTLTLSFTTINALIISSYVVVTLPSQVSISSGSCSSNVASTCQTTSSSITLTLTSAVSKATTITITIVGFKNPSTTQTTSSFVINSYYRNVSTPVDQLSSGLTLQASAAVLNSVTVGSGSLVVGDTSSYTLNIKNTNDLPSQSYILIMFPSTSFPISSSASLTSFKIGTSVISSCVFNKISSYIFNFTNCIASTIPSLSTIQIVINNIKNPLSTKPTDSLTVQTYFNAQLMESLSTGITVTMTTPASFQFSTFSSISSIVNAITSYTITLTTSQSYTTGYKVIVTLPSSLTLLSSYQCSSTTISISCTQFASGLVVTLSGTIPSTFPITISNIQNNWYSTSLSITITTSLPQNNNYIIEQGAATSTITPSTLTYSFTPTNTIILLSSSIITITLTSPFTISGPYPSLLKFVITLPQQLTSPSACSTSISSSNCAINSNILTITDINSFTTSIQITFTANSAYFTTSSAFTSVLSYNNSNIALDSSLKITPFCTSPCKSCSSTSSCLSCLPSPYNSLIYLVSANSTCVSTCPDGYYAQSVSSSCKICDAICLTCTSTATQCTSCSSTSFLFNKTCQSNCPSTYYGFSSKCVPCVNQCYQCTSATLCNNCLSGYFLNPDYSCKLTCPSGYVGNASNCVSCQSPCVTCSGSVSSCTSCNSSNILYNFTCISSCPLGLYNSTNQCVACISPCKYCSTNLLCTSCVSGYYIYNVTQCVATCPPGTFVYLSNCQTCNTSCQTCQGTATNCTACNSGTYLYMGGCYSTCPLPTYSSGSICSTCISPCATCLSTALSCASCVDKYYLSEAKCVACISPCNLCTSAILCTSCVNGYLLYNNTQCVLSCPGGFYQFVSQCSACGNKCKTCNGISTNCTSCASGMYFYLGDCYQACPSPTYPYNGGCTTCAQPCATCLSSAFSCSTCIDNYYLLNSTCLSSCPSAGYLVQGAVCIACPVNCVACTSSINCTMCQSPYFVSSGICVSQCPLNAPILVNQVCKSCSTECQTCSINIDNCTSCKIYYFKYSYSCVKTCPIGTYSDTGSYECTSGLLYKIVFFPVMITQCVVIVFFIIVKCFSKGTAFVTTVTSFSGWLQLAIWFYLLSLLFGDTSNVSLDYTLPRILIVMAIIFMFGVNPFHYVWSNKKLAEDQYARKWQDINLNNTVFKVVRIISLFSSHKFFRVIYCKLFHSVQFSLVVYSHANLFFPSTVFTLVSLVASQLPAIVAAFYLAYNKYQKDQVFYTALQTLVVTIVSMLFALVDIYKSKDYFQDTQFMTTKRFLQKVNNDSINKMIDQQKLKDETSMDGERIMGVTGGKLIFSRKDPGSMNQLYFQENSMATDLHQNVKRHHSIHVEDIQNYDSDDFKSKTRSPLNSPVASKTLVSFSKKKINIFEPIEEQEAEYYEVLKYDEEDFKTEAKIMKEKGKDNESDIEQEQLVQQRRQQIGLQSRVDDNRSLMEYRERRQKWNNIITHRQQINNQIFNTIDTKHLYQIDEPEQIEEEEGSPKKNKNYGVRSRVSKDVGESQEGQGLRKRRKKRNRKGNKELQQIYLQRLAQKSKQPKRRRNQVSSKTLKYQF